VCSSLREFLGGFSRSLTRWPLNAQEACPELHHSTGRDPWERTIRLRGVASSVAFLGGLVTMGFAAYASSQVYDAEAFVTFLATVVLLRSAVVSQRRAVQILLDRYDLPSACGSKVLGRCDCRIKGHAFGSINQPQPVQEDHRCRQVDGRDSTDGRDRDSLDRPCHVRRRCCARRREPAQRIYEAVWMVIRRSPQT
jgi:hypothetical protein